MKRTYISILLAILLSSFIMMSCPHPNGGNINNDDDQIVDTESPNEDDGISPEVPPVYGTYFDAATASYNQNSKIITISGLSFNDISENNPPSHFLAYIKNKFSNITKEELQNTDVHININTPNNILTLTPEVLYKISDFLQASEAIVTYYDYWDKVIQDINALHFTVSETVDLDLNFGNTSNIDVMKRVVDASNYMDFWYPHFAVNGFDITKDIQKHILLKNQNGGVLLNLISTYGSRNSDNDTIISPQAFEIIGNHNLSITADNYDLSGYNGGIITTGDVTWNDIDNMTFSGSFNGGKEKEGIFDTYIKPLVFGDDMKNLNEGLPTLDFTAEFDGYNIYNTGLHTIFEKYNDKSKFNLTIKGGNFDANDYLINGNTMYNGNTYTGNAFKFSTDFFKYFVSLSKLSNVEIVNGTYNITAANIPGTLQNLYWNLDMSGIDLSGRSGRGVNEFAGAAPYKTPEAYNGQIVINGNYNGLGNLTVSPAYSVVLKNVSYLDNIALAPISEIYFDTVAASNEIGDIYGIEDRISGAVFVGGKLVPTDYSGGTPVFISPDSSKAIGASRQEWVKAANNNEGKPEKNTDIPTWESGAITAKIKTMFDNVFLALNSSNQRNG